MNDMEGATPAVKELVAQVKKGTCILFLGAGVHAPPPPDSGYTYPQEHRPPLGGDLAERLAKERGFAEKFPNESPRDLQRVSLYIETTPGLGRKILVDDLERHLREGKKPSPALEMLARLPLKIIVTTNYDRLLEFALAKCDKDPARFVYNPDQNERTRDMSEDPTENRPLLFRTMGQNPHRMA